MGHPKLELWIAGMKATSRAKRAQTWEDVCDSANQLSREDSYKLLRSLEKEESGMLADERFAELHFMFKQLIRFLAAQPWAKNSETTIDEWFFAPFRPRFDGSGISNPCAAIGVCDREHIRDVQAQLILARYLSKDRFPDTEFYHVPLLNPDWSDVGTDKINALCAVGRPSMFVRCPVLEAVELNKTNLRFGLPLDDEQWRSRPLNTASANAYHHVLQTPPPPRGFQSAAGRRISPYCAVDINGRRTDYAIVQRLRLMYNNRPLTVVILAGATSLGTVGAAQWVTNGELVALLKEKCQGRDLRDETELEALLEVTADIRNPARPWDPIGRNPLKLFVDDSVNLLGPTPSQITIITGDPGPDNILLDDDEVRFKGKGRSALIAICKAFCRKLPRPTSAIFEIQELQKDETFMKESGCARDGDLGRFLRDHIQGKLGDAVTIEDGFVKFHCGIHQIGHSQVFPS